MHPQFIEKHKLRIPNLEKVNLINRYTSYLQLVRAGIFEPQAKAITHLDSPAVFQKARAYYESI